MKKLFINTGLGIAAIFASAGYVYAQENAATTAAGGGASITETVPSTAPPPLPDSIPPAERGNTKTLEELVVVGYGTQKRSKITSSVSTVESEAVENGVKANAAAALQGTVPGVRVVNVSGSPGQAPNVVLRGGASINAQGQPLYVVDGIVRDLADISSLDIESMQVMKDAAATAIYGARANNGVVLVNTKRGKKGQADITYQGRVGSNLRRQGGVQFMSAGEYLKYSRLGAMNQDNATANTPTPSNRVSAMLTATGYGPNTATPGIFNVSYDKAVLDALKMGKVESIQDPADATKQIYFIDHNGKMADQAFNSAPMTNEHHISAYAGNDKATFGLSLGYYNEQGLIINTAYERYSGMLNGSYKLKDNVEVFGALNFAQSSRPELWMPEDMLFYRTLAIWPTLNPLLADGSPTPGVPNYGNGNIDGNPRYWSDIFQNANQTRRTTMTAGTQWEIIPQLILRATGNIYTNDYVSSRFQKYSSSADGKTVPTVIRPASKQFANETQQQHNLTLQYSKDFASKHHIDALVGTEFFDFRRSSDSAGGSGASSDAIFTLNSVANSTTAPSRITGINEHFRMISGFARINYDYNDKYLFTAVARLDGTSQLINNQFGFFPGVSAGWNVHKEDFMTGIRKIVSYLKPRVSYGLNGNLANLGYYTAQGGYNASTSYNGNQSFSMSGLYNPNLRWEQSTSLDLGIDMGFIDNRIFFGAAYFNRLTTDLLTNQALPSYMGIPGVVTNLGSYRNQGIELDMKVDILRNSKGLHVDVGANASFVKNRIEKLPNNGVENNRQGGLLIADGQGGYEWVAPQGSFMEGATLGDIYAYKQEKIISTDADLQRIGKRYDAIGQLYGPDAWAALPFAQRAGKKPIEKGDVLWADRDNNNIIDSRDQVHIGNIYPKWTGGFFANLSYKGIKLYVLFDFAIGHTLYNDQLARTYGSYQGSFNLPTQVANSWQKDGDNTIYPKFYFADQLGKYNLTRGNAAGSVLNGNNSIMYEKGDYLCLRDITISYSLPAAWVNKLKLKEVSIFATGQNLAYFTGYSGLSPEPATTAILQRQVLGVDQGRYPVPITILGGLKITL